MQVVCEKNAFSNCCNRWQVNQRNTHAPKSSNVEGLQSIMRRIFVENIMALRQKVQQLSWKPKVHYHVRKIEPLDRIHSDMN